MLKCRKLSSTNLKVIVLSRHEPVCHDFSRKHPPLYYAWLYLVIQEALCSFPSCLLVDIFTKLLQKGKAKKIKVYVPDSVNLQFIIINRKKMHTNNFY